jgi:multidrug transporter EmrE-like cation transporter
MTLLLLACAIAAEVIGTLALKAADGFTRLYPSLLVLVGYGAAFVLLSLVLKLGMPVGTAYAIWASLGVVLVAVAGHLIFDEVLTAKAVLGIGLIVAGVILVEVGH